MIKIITDDIIHLVNENTIESISYHKKEGLIVIHTGKYNRFRIKKTENEEIFKKYFQESV